MLTRISVPEKAKPPVPALDFHFRGRRADMRPLFDRLIAELSKRCDFDLQIGKTYIGLKHRVVFAGLYVQTKKILVEIVVRREFKCARINKVVQFAPKRWAHFVAVQTDKDIDEQLLRWLQQSCE